MFASIFDRDDDRDSDNDQENQGDIAIKESQDDLDEPPKYAVILYNDDYTTMDFVVEVLRRFFRKSQEEAVQITMTVHREGKGLAGIFSRDIAETKVVQVTEYARAKGFPLRSAAEQI